jgi:hypothetical protein
MSYVNFYLRFIYLICFPHVNAINVGFLTYGLVFPMSHAVFMSHDKTGEFKFDKFKSIIMFKNSEKRPHIRFLESDL